MLSVILFICLGTIAAVYIPDIVKNWILLRKSTDQYRPSPIPKESCTHLILPPKALSRCFRPRPACLPESMKRCPWTMLNQISPRSTPPPIRHSVYTPLTNLHFHHPDSDVALISLSGQANTRPHMHPRRSLRLRSSSIGPSGGNVVPEGGEGGGVGQCSA